IGLLKDVSRAISAKKVNIVSLNTEDKNKNFPIINIVLNLKDRPRLQALILELKKVKGVEEIEHKFGNS
ncbi:hypothetical protein HYT45_00255, partial [Candidatus Uhrbacteria bacterium]|nr:hypothetical protein [Candidatus Uhrbacteria bacterium]